MSNLSVLESIDVTVVMPTLNAEKTLQSSLASLKCQSYPQEKIHILIVDGGSTDSTKRIAQKYGCTILHNKKIQQEYGKQIGIQASESRYLMFLDADEVLENKDDLKRKIDAFVETDVPFLWSSGYKKPPDAPFINEYINLFSDPFAFFMYRVSADYQLYIPSMQRRYPRYSENSQRLIFRFSELDQLPLLDLAAGAMIDQQKLQMVHGLNISKERMIPTCFQQLMRHDPRLAIVKDCPVIHYSAETFQTYIYKLCWRVIANIHYPSIPGTGFTNRATLQKSRSHLKKYLFIPYALTILPATIDAFVMAIRTRKIIAFLQIPLSFLTAILILYHALLRSMGIRPALPTYGKKTD
ncbi:MAG: glycosyltransferase [Pirellulales bacterium]